MTKLAHSIASGDCKRPAMLFYCGDYLRDTNLSACGLAAQGLWMRMICLMHDMRPYGVFSLKGNSIPMPVLARMAGATIDEAKRLLPELEAAGVFNRTPDGLIYSRRMVRDEIIRAKRAAGGVESLKHPKVPRPKASLGKDHLQGHPSSAPNEGSSLGSPSFAVSDSSSDSSAWTTSSSEPGPSSEGISTQCDAAAAVNSSLEDVPADVRSRLEALGVGDATAHALAKQVGGWAQLRFALERLMEKQASGEVHNASGLLVKRVRELAEEGRGLSQSRLRILESQAPEAFKDSRWIQLPLVVRETPAVGVSWVRWWKAKLLHGSSSPGHDSAHLNEEREAWKALLGITLEFHPDQVGVRGRVEQALQAIQRKSDSDLVLSRARLHCLAKELGLV